MLALDAADEDATWERVARRLVDYVSMVSDVHDLAPAALCAPRVQSAIATAAEVFDHVYDLLCKSDGGRDPESGPVYAQEAHSRLIRTVVAFEMTLATQGPVLADLYAAQVDRQRHAIATLSVAPAAAAPSTPASRRQTAAAAAASPGSPESPFAQVLVPGQQIVYKEPLVFSWESVPPPPPAADNTLDVTQLGYELPPLHHSAATGDIAELQRLLADEDDFQPPDLEDEQKRVPLYFAIAAGHTECVRILIEDYFADVTPIFEEGTTLLHLAALQGRPDCIEMLLAAGLDANVADDLYRTPLHYAVSQIDAVRVLLAAGAMVEATDDDDRTPMHHTANAGHPFVAQALGEAGAAVDEPDALGRTPLAIAAAAGNTSMVEWLLACQVPMDADLAGFAPYEFALLSPDPSVADLIKRHMHLLHRLAMDNDADGIRAVFQSPNPPDVDLREGGKTALYWAIREAAHDAMCALLEAGADPTARDVVEDKPTPLHLAIAWDRADTSRAFVEALQRHYSPEHVSAILEIPDAHDRTPLHLACHRGQASVAAALIAAGASPEAVDAEQRTCLHYAAFSQVVECVELLLGSGARVDRVDRGLRTPLMYAAAGGSADLTRILIAAGARVDTKDSVGFSPMDYMLRPAADPVTGEAPDQGAPARDLGWRDWWSALGQQPSPKRAAAQRPPVLQPINPMLLEALCQQHTERLAAPLCVGDLPAELLLSIFARLDPRDLLRAMHVCRRWHSLLHDDSLWRRHLDAAHACLGKGAAGSYPENRGKGALDQYLGVAKGVHNIAIGQWNSHRTFALDVLHDVSAVGQFFDHRRLVVGDLDGGVTFWEVDGDLVEQLGPRNNSAHLSAVTTFACVPDGSVVVSTGLDGRVVLWNTDTGTVLDNLAGPTNRVRVVEIDAETLVCGSDDHCAWVWERSDLTQVEILQGHQGSVNLLKLKPEYILAGTRFPGSISFWSRYAIGGFRQLLQRIDLTHDILGIELLDVGAHPPTGWTAAFDETEQRELLPFALTVSQSGTMWSVFRCSSGELVTSHQPLVDAFDRQLAEDMGKPACYAKCDWLLALGLGLTVRLYDLSSLTMISRGCDHQWPVEAVSALALPSLGRRPMMLLASVDSVGSVRMWDAERGLVLARIDQHRWAHDGFKPLAGRLRMPTKVELCPEGVLVHGGPYYHTVEMFDARAGVGQVKKSLVQTLTDHTSPLWLWGPEFYLLKVVVTALALLLLQLRLDGVLPGLPLTAGMLGVGCALLLWSDLWLWDVAMLTAAPAVVGVKLDGWLGTTPWWLVLLTPLVLLAWQVAVFVRETAARWPQRPRRVATLLRFFEERLLAGADHASLFASMVMLTVSLETDSDSLSVPVVLLPVLLTYLLLLMLSSMTLPLVLSERSARVVERTSRYPALFGGTTVAQIGQLLNLQLVMLGTSLLALFAAALLAVQTPQDVGVAEALESSSLIWAMVFGPWYLVLLVPFGESSFKVIRDLSKRRVAESWRSLRCCWRPRWRAVVPETSALDQSRQRRRNGRRARREQQAADLVEMVLS